MDGASPRPCCTFCGAYMGPSQSSSISDGERLSRLIHHHSDFTASTGHVDYRLFLPPAKGTFSQELSVARSEGLTEEEAWELADEMRIGAIGRADFLAGNVAVPGAADSQLRVVPDEPPRRHAIVIGWPPVEERERRKQAAQQLRLRIRPTLVVRSVPPESSEAHR